MATDTQRKNMKNPILRPRSASLANSVSYSRRRASYGKHVGEPAERRWCGAFLLSAQRLKHRTTVNKTLELIKTPRTG